MAKPIRRLKPKKLVTKKNWKKKNKLSSNEAISELMAIRKEIVNDQVIDHETKMQLLKKSANALAELQKKLSKQK